MDPKVSLLLRLESGLADALRRAAGVTGRTPDDLVAEALRDWLAAHPEALDRSPDARAARESLAEFEALCRRLKK